MQEKLANLMDTQNSFTEWGGKGSELFTMHENKYSR